MNLFETDEPLPEEDTFSADRFCDFCHINTAGMTHALCSECGFYGCYDCTKLKRLEDGECIIICKKCLEFKKVWNNEPVRD